MDLIANHIKIGVDDPSIMSARLTKIINKTDIKQIHIFLMMLADYCAQQSKLHDVTRVKFRRYNYGIAIPAILLSTISGSVNLITSVKDECNTSDSIASVIGIICGVSGLISAGMLSIHRYANFAELEQMHTFYGDAYEKKNLEIRSNILLDSGYENKTFSNLYEYLKFSRNEVCMLIDKSPPIPEKIKKLYKNKRSLIDVSELFESNR
jgi:hypothetical protein